MDQKALNRLCCATVLCCYTVLLCCATMLCHCAVILCCATMLCYCAVLLRCATVLLCYYAVLLCWLTVLCCCATVLYYCTVLLCCTTVLCYCAVLLICPLRRRFLLSTHTIREIATVIAIVLNKCNFYNLDTFVFRYLLQFSKVQILTKLNSKPEETSKLFRLYCLAFVAYYGFARCSRIIKRLGT